MALTPLDQSCRRCTHRAHGLPGARCPVDQSFLVATTAPATDALVGRELAPDLVLFDVLSDGGGFGRVYRAVQLRLAREVVVKVLRPQQAEVALGRARFLQEARLLAELSDEPRVVTVHDCGEVGDLLYLVLARAPGEPLSARLRAGPLPEEAAVALVRQVLLALAAVHARGQVHRDLKPDNIIVQGPPTAPQVTLIDFGIAKVLNSQEDSPRTATDVSLGTPRSMAPEQLQAGGEVGPWTDVYAAGVLLFELLVGRPPFEGSAAELVGAHLYQPPPEVPGPYGAVVAQALAKRPQDRFADATEMAQALASVGGARAEASEIIALSPTLDTVERVQGPRWRWGPAAGVAGALVLLALFAWPRGQPLDVLEGILPAKMMGGPASLMGGPASLMGGPARVAPTPARVAPASVAEPKAPAPVSDPVEPAAPTTKSPAPAKAAPASAKPVRAAAPAAPATAAPAAPATAAPAPATAAPAAPATAAPATRPAAPATASPALTRRLRDAVRTCACDRARALLAEAAQTADHAALQTEVERCRPKLPGLACRYEGP